MMGRTPLSEHHPIQLRVPYCQLWQAYWPGPAVQLARQELNVAERAGLPPRRSACFRPTPFWSCFLVLGIYMDSDSHCSGRGLTVTPWADDDGEIHEHGQLIRHGAGELTSGGMDRLYVCIGR